MHVPIFSGGTPEELLWMIQDIKKIITGQSLMTEMQKFKLGRCLLEGDALAVFNVAIEGLDNGHCAGSFEQVLDELIAHVFPKRALVMQKR